MPPASSSRHDALLAHLNRKAYATKVETLKEDSVSVSCNLSKAPRLKKTGEARSDGCAKIPRPPGGISSVSLVASTALSGCDEKG